MPSCVWPDLMKLSGEKHGEYTLLDLCASLHGVLCGSSESLSTNEILYGVTILKKACDNWESGNSTTVQYDAAVLALINVVIAEANLLL